MFRSLGISFLSVFLFSAFALAQDQIQTNLTTKSDAWNKVCPIDGKAINQEIKMITYKDHKYGFCGEDCAVLFKENPEAYIKNLSDDGTKFIGDSKSKVPDKNK
jgi:YHS domain-containing protein